MNSNFLIFILLIIFMTLIFIIWGIVLFMSLKSHELLQEEIEKCEEIRKSFSNYIKKTS